TRAGLFVELDETGADGFIPARSIGDEYFRYQEASHAFVGASVTHRLGDPVAVRLVEAAPVAGALRFQLVSEGRSTRGAERIKHSARSHHPSKRAPERRGHRR